jgi:hypothetical protein
MKSLRLVAVLSLAVPLALVAQTSTNPGTNSAKKNSPSTTAPQSGATQTGSSKQSDTTKSGGAAASSSSANTADGSVQRVDKEELKTELTAKNLIGKDVYDTHGTKIGSVKDIVLEGQAPDLAAEFAAGSNRSANNTSNNGADASRVTPGADYGAGSPAPGASTDSDVATSNASSSKGSANRMSSASSSRNLASSDDSRTPNKGMSAGSTGSGDTGPQHAKSMASSSEPSVIISSGFAGFGPMLRVPISQLNYNSQEKHLTLAISDAELDKLKSTSNRYSDTAN